MTSQEIDAQRAARSSTAGDGIVVRIIAHGADYPFSAEIKLSASVANNLIARGIAELSS